MFQENFALNNSQASAVSPKIAKPMNGVSASSADALHLNTALVLYASIEFCAVACAAYFASSVYHYVSFGSVQSTPIYVLAAGSLASLVLVISVAFHNFFAFRRQPRHIFLWRGIGSVGLAFSVFLTTLFFTQSAEAYSRGSLIFQFICVAITIVGSRAIFYSWMQRAIASGQIEARRVALVGDSVQCAKFAKRLNAVGINTVGTVQLPQSGGWETTFAKTEIIREIISGLRPLRVDDIIVLANNSFLPMVFDFTSSLGEIPVGVHIVPVEALNVLAASQIDEFGNLRTIQVCQAPLTKFDLFVKRAFDVFVAVGSLIVLSPLFFVISIAIKLDSPGPVFFRNTRHGFNNEKITVLKFRSMTTLENGDQFIQATRNDPRVTRIGRIIRRTNIDELPQLLNVLRGEMSLVGPRPHATAHNALYDKVITPFSRRHNVKPGITGWAQVNGFRGATDQLEKMQRRVEYDLYYIDNWSFLFDLKIILMTLFSRKAYLNAY